MNDEYLAAAIIYNEIFLKPVKAYIDVKSLNDDNQIIQKCTCIIFENWKLQDITLPKRMKYKNQTMYIEVDPNDMNKDIELTQNDKLFNYKRYTFYFFENEY